MRLRRLVDEGKKELSRLQTENLVLKTADQHVLRKSLLDPDPLMAPGADHMIKEDSSLDPNTLKVLAGEMKMEMSRLRKLSDVSHIPPSATSPHSDMRQAPSYNHADSFDLPDADNDLSLASAPGNDFSKVKN